MRHKICSIILVWLRCSATAPFACKTKCGCIQNLGCTLRRDFYRDLSDDSSLVATLKSFLGISPSTSDDPESYGTCEEYLTVEVDWSNLMLVKDVMQRVLEDRMALLAVNIDWQLFVHPTHSYYLSCGIWLSIISSSLMVRCIKSFWVRRPRGAL